MNLTFSGVEALLRTAVVWLQRGFDHAPSPAAHLPGDPTASRKDFIERFSRHCPLAGLGLPFSLLILAPLLSAQSPPQSSVFYQDFRGGRALPDTFQLLGPNADALTHSENDGFRITVPAHRPITDRIGLQMLPTIKGDFEISAGYEIIQMTPPNTGPGIGFELYVSTASMSDAVSISRVASVDRGGVYLVSRHRMIYGEERTKERTFATTTKAGRLRIGRKGAAVTVSAAEGSGPFQDLYQYDFGSEDMELVWLSALARGTTQGVDLRVVDLKIQSQSLSVDAEIPSSSNAVGPAPRRWLLG